MTDPVTALYPAAIANYAFKIEVGLWHLAGAQYPPYTVAREFNYRGKPMSMTIWKHSVDVQDAPVEIQMPRGAKILTVQNTSFALSPCIWTLCDPANPYVKRRLFWRGTGHDAESCAGMQYVGTIQQLGGALIWHLFAEPEPTTEAA